MKTPAKGSAKSPRKMDLTSILHSGLCCPHCKRQSPALTLTCTHVCQDGVKKQWKLLEAEIERVNFRFASFWATVTEVNLVILPNVRSPHAFLIRGKDLAEALALLQGVPIAPTTAQVEAHLNKLAKKGGVEVVEKDLFIPLQPAYREFLELTNTPLSKIEEFLPPLDNFMPGLKVFAQRIRRMVERAVRSDKKNAKPGLRQSLDSAFWEHLLKTEPSGKYSRESLLGYPGLDFSETSPLFWRFGKFGGVVPPDAKKVHVLAEQLLPAAPDVQKASKRRK